MIDRTILCIYNKYMEIQFDQNKDAANKEKHGAFLQEATLLDWDTALVWIDDRKDYSERRECALGVIGGRVYFCAFTRRGEALRIISLRKANLREAKYYVENS